ncbi:MAG TPA: RNA methyltransferase [Lentisphaeria bacterium]|nr:MAG: hypothetical protein A2X47_06495 [Lentisphaerae bacterium GWF2_38_69]HBM15520.1 RNA methyltransferase [Lentisphaeria bacterium]
MTQQNYRQISIILDRLRSAHNTGNIFRLADAVGAYEVIACGYTPCPPHPKLTKTAMGSEKYVKCRHFESSLEAVRVLRNENYRMILAVETGENSVCAWQKDYLFPLALIFGNEALGVDKDTVSECDGIIGLPMLGKKISINVGNCAAAVLYSVLARERNSKIKS